MNSYGLFIWDGKACRVRKHDMIARVEDAIRKTYHTLQVWFAPSRLIANYQAKDFILFKGNNQECRNLCGTADPPWEAKWHRL
jgi:hypothetical protein